MQPVNTGSGPASLPNTGHTVTGSILDPLSRVQYTLGNQTSGGVKIEVVRLVIGHKNVLERSSGLPFSKVFLFNDYPVGGEIIFSVTNTTNKTVLVNPAEGTVAINSEQVRLDEWLSVGVPHVDSDPGNEFLPGVTATGGVWFDLKTVDVPDVKPALVSIKDPHDEKNVQSLGPKFNFAFDLSKHEYQPVPTAMPK